MPEHRHKPLVNRRHWLTSTLARAASAPGALRLALPRFLLPNRPLMFAARLQRGAGLTAGAALAATARPASAATVVAARVWPSQDYTRVTLELDEALEYSHFVISDPERIVVDIKGMTVDQAFRDLVARIKPSDPYSRQVRVGQFNPTTARIVFDVKQPVKPQLFTLEPIENYRFRLVIDLYPTRPPDPLDLLIAQTEAATLLRELERANAAEAATAPPGSRPAPATPAGPGAAGTPAAPPEAPPVLAQGGEPAAPTTRAKGKRPTQQPKAIVDRLITVAIDPGHGGEDPGAIGPRGTYEKDVVLAIALRLRDQIAAEPNMRAFLTRDGDYYVALATRVQKARAVKADLFISIHADAAPRGVAQGSSVFVLSDRGASSVEARWLAQRENRADQIGGVSLQTRNREAARVLMQLITQTQIRDSKRLGSAILNELGGLGRLHKPQVEQASFAVLKSPDTPSILVETAFISNPEEERKLRDARYQDRTARAIMSGIRNYFIAHPPGPRGKRT